MYAYNSRQVLSVSCGTVSFDRRFLLGIERRIKTLHLEEFAVEIALGFKDAQPHDRGNRGFYLLMHFIVRRARCNQRRIIGDDKVLSFRRVVII